jgi:hypothetical protein
MISRRIASRAVVAVAAAALVTAQFVPVKRTNFPQQGALLAPPEIEATLRRACYDCHSSETRWPWYSRVAPLSWYVVREVNRGRKEVNFSQWGSYYPATRRRKLEWIGRALHEENMPPWSYRLMHPGARVTPAERDALQQWIESALTTLPPAAPNK